MSPSVHNFVHDLVAMAQAMDRLPQVESELTRAQTMINDQAETIQRLELKLINKEAEADTLRANIRQLEVSRDDAELRFLECDDAKDTLVRTLETLSGEIAGVLAAVRPIPPSLNEPVLMPVNEPLVEVKTSEPDPTPETVQPSGNGPHEEVGNASNSTDPQAATPGPYTDLRYYDYPHYVSPSAWLAGGGTEESYNWRPSRPSDDIPF